MSGPGGFDPSLLEGKDRAELAAIATQLGQKPGARAKKADIVALIMRLVGADAPGEDAAPAAQQADLFDGGAPTESAAEAEAEPAASAAAESSSAPAPAAPAAEAPASAGGRGERASGTDGQAKGNGNQGQAKGNQGQPKGDQGNDSQGKGNQGNGNQPRGDQGKGEQGKGDQGNGDQPNGNQAPPAPTGNPNHQPEPQDGEESESGNRRRRRRGRDRDRRAEGGDEQSQPEPIEVEGLMELREEGYGFLRLQGFLPSSEDTYVSVKQVRQFGLRTGDIVRGKARAANRNERNPALLQVDAVNGYQAHNQPPRPRFADLTPVFPTEQLRFELADDPANVTVRAVDLIAPIGKGQRSLVVAPPRSGKTTLLRHLVRSVEVNEPEADLIVVLVDERPEEITEMQRWLVRGQVAAASFERPLDEQLLLAQLAIERAKRLVEQGRDVVVILDGVTRLARAHNLAAPAGGRILDAGLDASAVQPVKALLGAARNVEEGGSLTVVATITADSGSRLDDVIFEEFSGTANQELRLDRTLAEREIFPAIDVAGSGTRRPEEVVGRDGADRRRQLRTELLEAGSAAGAVEALVARLGKAKTNDALLEQIKPAKG